jgi:DNA mismatch repair ATPase MutL
VSQKSSEEPDTCSRKRSPKPEGKHCSSQPESRKPKAQPQSKNTPFKKPKQPQPQEPYPAQSEKEAEKTEEQQQEEEQEKSFAFTPKESKPQFKPSAPHDDDVAATSAAVTLVVTWLVVTWLWHSTHVFSQHSVHVFASTLHLCFKNQAELLMVYCLNPHEISESVLGLQGTPLQCELS